MHDNETLHPSESIVLLNVRLSPVAEGIVLLNVRLSPVVEGIMLLHVGLTRAD